MSRMKYSRLPADLSGLRFGRLTALKATGERKNRSPVWLCQCDCGNTVAVPRQSLVSYSTQSCGCLRAYLAEQKEQAQNIHHSRAVLYRVWADLFRKCTNPEYENYANFGGRGVKMCAKWLENPDTFIDWSLANGYDTSAPEGHNALDLIDPNGDYCPENCFWSDTQSVLARLRELAKKEGK